MANTTGTGLTAFASTTAPILEGGDSLYVDKQFNRVESALKGLLAACPQAATKAPTSPPDGAQRLARSPWRPVTGQTEDRWVYWDASVSSWKYLNDG